MRITPIYNYPYPQKNAKRKTLRTFQSRQTLMQAPLAKQTPASDYIHLIQEYSKQQPPKFEDWAKTLIFRGTNVGEKYINNGLGQLLSEVLYTKLVRTGIDYSDGIAKIRNAILNECFKINPDNGTNEPSIKDANEYMYKNFQAITSTINLLGEDGALTAVQLKQGRFESLIKNVHHYDDSNQEYIIDLLRIKTNPEKTELYRSKKEEQAFITKQMTAPEFKEFFSQHEENKTIIKELEKQIKILKQNFSVENKQKIKDIYSQITELRRKDFESKPTALLELENKMTTIKAQLNQLLNNSIKDPVKKIQLFHLHQAICTENAYKELLNLNTAISGGEETLRSYLGDHIQSMLKLTNEELQTFFDLEINESYHFPKIFEATKATCRNLKTLLATISTRENIEKTFNDLEHNKITQEVFEKSGYDFDIWSKYDAKRDYIQIDENTVIKKVDMNDIKHSLFLGNQVGCCTAIGSSTRSHIAPNYIINKFVQAIELVVNGVPVANTMCYFADIGFGRNNVFVLDNIEALPPYSTEPNTLDHFVTFANKMLKDIGAPNTPICTGVRMKVKSEKLKEKLLFNHLKILGDSGKYEMNLDSISSMSLMNQSIFPEAVFRSTFYTLSEIPEPLL